MNEREARIIRQKFYRIGKPSEEDIFLFTEAMDLLIRKNKDPNDMMDLGGFYYENKYFDLALKYYEMAAEQGDIDAFICLGYIWYYGRTGAKDYKKAFFYFCAGRDAGDLQAAYKVADMYKNGFFVEKDYEKYCSIIEDLYPKIKRARYLGDPLPEIFTRLARIRMDQKRYGEAQFLLIRAKDFLAQRIREHSFFGDLSIMKWLIHDMYSLPEKLRPTDIDLYDMYHFLEKPVKVTFRCCKKTELEIRSSMEDGVCVIQFGGRWFRDVDDFFAKAEYDGELLTTMYEEFIGWEVTEESADGDASEDAADENSSENTGAGEEKDAAD